MVYVRGNPADFDRWQQMGAEEWGYDDVLSYFKKAQSFADLDTPHPYKGHDGPLSVTYGRLTNPLHTRF